jgi:hypothetical protein
MILATLKAVASSGWLNQKRILSRKKGNPYRAVLYGEIGVGKQDINKEFHSYRLCSVYSLFSGGSPYVSKTHKLLGSLVT